MAVVRIANMSDTAPSIECVRSRREDVLWPAMGHGARRQRAKSMNVFAPDAISVIRSAKLWGGLHHSSGHGLPDRIWSPFLCQR